MRMSSLLPVFRKPQRRVRQATRLEELEPRQLMSMVVSHLASDTALTTALASDVLDAVAEGRIGKIGSATFEADIGPDTSAPSQTADFSSSEDWVSGQTKAFTLAVDSAHHATFTIGGQTISYTFASPLNTTDLFIRARAAVSGSSMTVDSLYLNGMPVGDSSNAQNATGGLDVLQISDTDDLGGGFTLTGNATMTWTGTRPTNSQVAFQIKDASSIPLYVNSTGDSDAKAPSSSPWTGNANAAGAPEVTLKSIIEYQNATQKLQNINFDIPTVDPGYNGSQFVILASDLPNISVPVTVDGTSQPGFGSSPIVAVVGEDAGTGLTIAATGDVGVKGLECDSFDTGISDTNGSGDNIFSNDAFSDVNIGLSLNLSSDATGTVEDSSFSAATTGLSVTTSLSSEGSLTIQNNTFNAGQQDVQLNVSSGGSVELTGNTFNSGGGSSGTAMAAGEAGDPSGGTVAENATINFTDPYGILSSHDNTFNEVFIGLVYGGDTTGTVNLQNEDISQATDTAGVFNGFNLEDGGLLTLSQVTAGDRNHAGPQNGWTFQGTYKSTAKVTIDGAKGNNYLSGLTVDAGGMGTFRVDNSDQVGRNQNGAWNFITRNGVGLELGSDNLQNGSAGAISLTANTDTSTSLTLGQLAIDGFQTYAVSGKVFVKDNYLFNSSNNTYKNNLKTGLGLEFSGADNTSTLTLNSSFDTITASGANAVYQFDQSLMVRQQLFNFNSSGASGQGLSVFGTSNIQLLENIQNSKINGNASGGIKLQMGSVGQGCSLDLSFQKNVVGDNTRAGLFIVGIFPGR